MKEMDSLVESLLAKPHKKFSLDDRNPASTGTVRSKAVAIRLLEQGIKDLARAQELLYAQDTWSVLILLQAMDAAGKDSTIEHVMSGVNPQGCQVFSFKAPSAEERDHDFLWRSVKALPERGRIGIHNRSYYEEVLVVRVHPNILQAQQLPREKKGKKKIWKERFEQINRFERYLTDNGTLVLKFFLHVSKQEQKRRFLERIDTPEKNWKFSLADVEERAYWDDYMDAYEDAIGATSTTWAPWYVVPADHKWFTRVAVVAAITERIKKLNLHFPVFDESRRTELRKARELLVAEQD